MGHTEMLLAVAGLDETSLTKRTRQLASGDWGSFTPTEQSAFASRENRRRHPGTSAGQTSMALSVNSAPMQRST